MNINKECPVCGSKLDAKGSCSECGFNATLKKLHPLHLEPGTMLAKRYMVGNVRSFHKFITTYSAYDTQTETVLTVDEFLPTDFLRTTERKSAPSLVPLPGREASFNNGIKVFCDATAGQKKYANGGTGFIKVYTWFRQNNTCYRVSEIPGEYENLRMYMKRVGLPISAEDVFKLFNRVVSDVTGLNNRGLYGISINPEFMYIDKQQMLILDWPCASFLQLPRLTPPEATKAETIGPWSDTFRLAALMYYLLTGQLPTDPGKRLRDKLLLKPLSEYAPVPKGFDLLFSGALEPDYRQRSVLAVFWESIASLVGSDSYSDKLSENDRILFENDDKARSAAEPGGTKSGMSNEQLDMEVLNELNKGLRKSLSALRGEPIENDEIKPVSDSGSDKKWQSTLSDEVSISQIASVEQQPFSFDGLEQSAPAKLKIVIPEVKSEPEPAPIEDKADESIDDLIAAVVLGDVDMQPEPKPGIYGIVKPAEAPAEEVKLEELKAEESAPAAVAEAEKPVEEEPVEQEVLPEAMPAERVAEPAPEIPAPKQFRAKLKVKNYHGKLSDWMSSTERHDGLNAVLEAVADAKKAEEEQPITVNRREYHEGISSIIAPLAGELGTDADRSKEDLKRSISDILDELLTSKGIVLSVQEPAAPVAPVPPVAVEEAPVIEAAEEPAEAVDSPSEQEEILAEAIEPEEVKPIAAKAPVMKENAANPLMAFLGTIVDNDEEHYVSPDEQLLSEEIAAPLVSVTNDEAKPFSFDDQDIVSKPIHITASEKPVDEPIAAPEAEPLAEPIPEPIVESEAEPVIIPFEAANSEPEPVEPSAEDDSLEAEPVEESSEELAPQPAEDDYFTDDFIAFDEAANDSVTQPNYSDASDEAVRRDSVKYEFLMHREVLRREQEEKKKVTGVFSSIKEKLLRSFGKATENINNSYEENYGSYAEEDYTAPIAEQPGVAPVEPAPISEPAAESEEIFEDAVFVEEANNEEIQAEAESMPVEEEESPVIDAENAEDEWDSYDSPLSEDDTDIDYPESVLGYGYNQAQAAAPSGQKVIEPAAPVDEFLAVDDMGLDVFEEATPDEKEEDELPAEKLVIKPVVPVPQQAEASVFADTASELSDFHIEEESVEQVGVFDKADAIDAEILSDIPEVEEQELSGIFQEPDIIAPSTYEATNEGEYITDEQTFEQVSLPNVPVVETNASIEVGEDIQRLSDVLNGVIAEPEPVAQEVDYSHLFDDLKIPDSYMPGSLMEEQVSQNQVNEGKRMHFTDLPTRNNPGRTIDTQNYPALTEFMEEGSVTGEIKPEAKAEPENMGRNSGKHSNFTSFRDRIKGVRR